MSPESPPGHWQPHARAAPSQRPLVGLTSGLVPYFETGQVGSLGILRPDAKGLAGAAHPALHAAAASRPRTRPLRRPESGRTALKGGQGALSQELQRGHGPADLVG